MTVSRYPRLPQYKYLISRYTNSSWWEFIQCQHNSFPLKQYPHAFTPFILDGFCFPDIIICSGSIWFIWKYEKCLCSFMDTGVVWSTQVHKLTLIDISILNVSYLYQNATKREQCAHVLVTTNTFVLPSWQWTMTCTSTQIAKGPQIDINYISIRYESVGSISNRYRSESLCSLGRGVWLLET